MLRKRFITVLTLNDGVLYRTRNFTPDYRYTLNFVDAWSVDEVVLLDITRPGEGDRQNFLDVVQLFARHCFVPLSVGGGVRTVDDFKQLLHVGADKIVVNTEAINRPDFITEASQQFGAQCVVVSIDAAKHENGQYEVRARFAKENTGITAVDWAKRAEELGAGEIMLQSYEKDGTLEGYDNELCRLISKAVDIPVLVCSGCGNWKHIEDGFNIGEASAACTTNIYHFTESSIHSAKEYLQRKGFEVRV